MLRMQLPVLLSFALMRCFIGYAVWFWSDRLLPVKAKTLLSLASRWIAMLALALNLSMLLSATAVAASFRTEWKKNAANERPVPNYAMCAEFACTRVQGLVCAIALFTMLAKADPLTLSLALATLKAVSDGTACVLVSASLTVATCHRLHLTHPVWFFLALYSTSCAHSFACYTNDDEETRGRIGCSVLSICFASLYLTFEAVRRVVRVVASRVLRVKRMVGRLLFAVKKD